MSSHEFVTFGETMVLLTNIDTAPLRHATHLKVGIGGAESNTAIGLIRQGHQAAWMGRVGDDEFGKLVLTTLRGEGIEVGSATVDPEAPTGLMIKGPRSSLVTDVVYYRGGSAASRLHPDHLNQDLITGAKVLYVTGITAAIGESARETVMAALETARHAGVMIGFDPNYRAALWGPEEAANWFREIAALSSVVLAGVDEAALMFGDGSPEHLARQLSGDGSRDALIKLGAEGTLGVINGEMLAASTPVVEALDPVGAGDAFAAGYIAGLLEDQDVATRLERACRTAALAVASRGDWEGLPTAAEILDTSTTDVKR